MNYSSLHKRVKRLESLLLESKQVGDLYHVCTLDNFVKYIVPTNSLSGSGNFTVGRSLSANKAVFFTRDKRYVINTAYDDMLMMDVDNSFAIQLCLDGDKLSDNYKVIPYNDAEFSVDIYDTDDDAEAILNPKNRAQEEVVLGTIKNLKKYIKSIRFVCTSGLDYNLKKNYNKIVNNIKKALSFGIDIIYDTKLENSFNGVGFRSWISDLFDIRNGDTLQDVYDALIDSKNDIMYGNLSWDNMGKVRKVHDPKANNDKPKDSSKNPGLSTLLSWIKENNFRHEIKKIPWNPDVTSGYVYCDTDDIEYRLYYDNRDGVEEIFVIELEDHPHRSRFLNLTDKTTPKDIDEWVEQELEYLKMYQ